MSNKKSYCVLGFSSHVGDPAKGNQECKYYVKASSASHAAEIALKKLGSAAFVYIRQVGDTKIKIYKGKLNKDPTYSHRKDGTSKVKYPFKVKRVIYHSKGSKVNKGSKGSKKSQQSKQSKHRRSRKTKRSTKRRYSRKSR